MTIAKVVSINDTSPVDISVNQMHSFGYCKGINRLESIQEEVL